MYTTGGLVFQNILGQDVMPRQNLFAHQDLFLYEYARYLLYRKLVTEGLLSPYATPFYPPTDITYRRTDEKDTNEQNVPVNKETIAEKLKINVNDITL